MNIENLFVSFMFVPLFFLLVKLKKEERKRDKEALDKSIKGYLNSSYNTKLISLCFSIIATLYGILKLEQNKNKDIVKNNPDKNLYTKLMVVLIILLSGSSHFYADFKIQNNKVLKYGYIIYGIIGLIFLFKYFTRKDIRNDL
jgi:hypothetical protein